MDNQEKEAAKGQRAAELLDNPILQEAFQLLKERYHQEWLASPARDTEGREKIWVALKVVETVQNHLHQTVEAGKFARVQINQSIAQQAMQKARSLIR